MSTDYEPIPGFWYKDIDKEGEFFIVEVYGDDGIVEIQHFDGDIEEIEMETWYEMNIESIEQPEDWVGPFDEIELDDLGYEE